MYWKMIQTVLWDWTKKHKAPAEKTVKNFKIGMPSGLLIDEVCRKYDQPASAKESIRRKLFDLRSRGVVTSNCYIGSNENYWELSHLSIYEMEKK